jgi:hypothetical protein
MVRIQWLDKSSTVTYDNNVTIRISNDTKTQFLHLFIMMGNEVDQFYKLFTDYFIDKILVD